MTVEDKKKLRSEQTFKRNEFLSIIGTSFEINTKPINYSSISNWDREEFSVYDTDIDVFRISYFSYKDFTNIHDIFIITWNGGWEHLQSYIKIDWEETSLSYSIEMVLTDGKSIKSRVVTSYRSKNKKEMTEILINFLSIIEPVKGIPLKRDYNLSLII